MMDNDTVKWFASLGVGGVLAGFMFLLYRKDSLQWQEAWRGQNVILVQVVKEVTAAVTTLTTYIKEHR